MISVCILTKNSAETIAKTLASVSCFPQVILLDNGSTDQTLEIARRFPNVCIHQTPFVGFGPLRNIAALLASHNWILALDSDEIVSEPLIEEINHMSLHLDFVYSFPRHNYYLGKWIWGCGWHPERVIRLYHREKTRFSDDRVHESLLTQNQTIQYVKHPLIHTPYRTREDFVRKMDHYSTLFAEQYQGKRSSSLFKALVHSAYAFFRSYLLKWGALCGTSGLFISLYNAKTTFYKYLKLKEKNDELKK